MGGIFATLNTSYTGLQAHQVMVDVTGNNISNANDEFYSRQRVIATPQSTLMYTNRNMNMGVNVQSIQRTHDEFVFARYAHAKQEQAYYSTQFDNLREASSYFPDMDEVGVHTDLQDYFNAWKDLAKDAKSPATKQALVQKTKTLTTSIHDARARLVDLQKKASHELTSTITEVNRLGREIANINKHLKEMEDAKTLKQANELRDKRDQLEFHLKELIGGNVTKNHIQTYSLNDIKTADFDDGYVFNVGYGFNIVDGAIFHPLVVEQNKNENQLAQIYFRGDDFKVVNITDKIDQGKVGALMGVYNDGLNGTRKGKLQTYIDRLDTFAKGLIQATNAIYAQSAAHRIEGHIMDFQGTEVLKDTNHNIKTGTFDLLAYNTNGQVIAKKTITITPITTMNDVIAQINANTDDNHDNNTTNDFDDYFVAHYDSDAKQFTIQPKNPSQGLFVSLRDHGTNFTGALGLNTFFEGDSARDIKINDTYRKEPTALRPWLAPIDGNFDVANMMQQLQYDKVDFFKDNKLDSKPMTLESYYQFLVGKVHTEAEHAKKTLESKDAILHVIKKEQQAISGVSTDEEMVNLIKFQSGYAANAKVVTAVDRMIETLLGMKQ
ncbi:flagellar hook-associated protein FlgK [Helicobacter heilmannii]|uniref:Flagellar hook-associated protein 1 n=1 Tax=Helicobacter heilmannii TaxID=35817 RepID=A0A0K2YAL0_HELHE|nr:flagellar hook-associated protein FlgK [Helicobacter heilmannii]BDQ27920.1 flagellar hook-associated protein FlgK [Helicobacter heilmannii]CRI35237.1 Flagellar hook-associated protein FlgK [Helicobacter heilmannii]